jgi:hypothetical protein
VPKEVDEQEKDKWDPKWTQSVREELARAEPENGHS